MHWIFFSCPLWKIFLKEIFSKVVVCQFFHLCHQYHLILSQSPSFLLSMFNEHCSSSFPFSPLFSSFMICNARAAQLHSWTVGLLYSCRAATVTQLYSCTVGLLYSCRAATVTQLYSFTVAQLHCYTVAELQQLHNCTIAQLQLSSSQPIVVNFPNCDGYLHGPSSSS